MILHKSVIIFLKQSDLFLFKVYFFALIDIHDFVKQYIN